MPSGFGHANHPGASINPRYQRTGIKGPVRNKAGSVRTKKPTSPIRSEALPRNPSGRRDCAARKSPRSIPCRASAAAQNLRPRTKPRTDGVNTPAGTFFIVFSLPVVGRERPHPACRKLSDLWRSPVACAPILQTIQRLNQAHPRGGFGLNESVCGHCPGFIEPARCRTCSGAQSIRSSPSWTVSTCRKNRRAHPFPLLDDVRVCLPDELAHGAEGFPAPVPEFGDFFRDKLRCRLALVRARCFHVVILEVPDISDLEDGEG